MWGLTIYHLLKEVYTYNTYDILSSTSCLSQSYFASDCIEVVLSAV